MAVRGLAASAALLVVFGLCGLISASDASLDPLQQRFTEWKVKYDKVYPSAAEEAKRFEIWKKELAYVEDFNSEHPGYCKPLQNSLLPLHAVNFLPGFACFHGACLPY